MQHSCTSVAKYQTTTQLNLHCELYLSVKSGSASSAASRGFVARRGKAGN